MGHPRRAQQRGIDPGGVYLRLERRNNRLLGYTSQDGKTWSRLDPMEPSYPATIEGRPVRHQRLHGPDERPIRGLPVRRGQGGVFPGEVQGRNRWPLILPADSETSPDRARA